tara:strand:+ start:4433 stop:4924 length:492 start_codon:yes stop_codon:yes gene_type:complete
MFGRLLILFITIPILELCIFMLLGSKIGIPTTLGIIVITAFLGAYLTKSQGLKALTRYQQAITEGKLPHEEVMDGLMILIAGAVLLTPGFLTDAIGFALLFPPVRDVVRGIVGESLKNRVSVAGQTANPPTGTPSGPQVINVEAEVIDDPSPPQGQGQGHQNQ